MPNIKIKTKGMHCTSCEMLLKESLEELEGVNKAEASFKTGIIKVDFDDAVVNLEKIKKAIKKEGYDLE